MEKLNTLGEWHKILGHCKVAVQKNETTGMHILNKEKFGCITCVLGKITQYRNRKTVKKDKQPLDLVHCDVKHHPYGNMKRLRCDHGTEFTNQEFRILPIENKIKQEFSAPYSPHQNGTAERPHKSIIDKAQCLPIESKLPKDMWGYTVNAACYIRNRSKEGIFAGYDNQSPTYLIYFLESLIVKKIRCDKFMENFPNVAEPPKDEQSSDEMTSWWRLDFSKNHFKKIKTNHQVTQVKKEDIQLEKDVNPED
ncbi:uncharacterized protein LOC119585366 [Penaeus monodon]|uniref:uncharacterized protein LOC119585366 n=1 Tax=Penaeus monodon TaxID=6687 RepID=UPI0018A78E86|nr:uncharacterized protein LOC119585366 [Penaeus monodon]